MRALALYALLFSLIYLLTLLGICLLMGIAAHPPLLLSVCAVGLLAGLGWLRRTVRRWRQERRIRRARYSELAETLTPQLEGDFSPFVIEAAEKLGEARDMSAVPALLIALERCVETQRPGWRDRATALTEALERIGDRRALPLLYRLENVRGIGLIPSIRSAIAAIEPQTSLLRPGSADNVPPQSLLRSVQQRPNAEESAILLRSVEEQ